MSSWDISKAKLVQSTTTTKDNDCIFFRPNGNKLYSINGAIVQEFDVGTSWDISTISFLQQLDVSATITSAQGIFFKTDGLKMYLLESFFNVYEFHEYDLSAAWDISSATYLQSSSTRLFFKPDGLKVYFFDSDNFAANEDSIFEYNLSVAWDITTAVYLQKFTIASTSSLIASSVFFKADGLKMYFVYLAGIVVNLYEYNLSVAWDVTTATAYQELIISNGMVFFDPDGSKLYLAEYNGTAIDEYELTRSKSRPTKSS